MTNPKHLDKTKPVPDLAALTDIPGESTPLVTDESTPQAPIEPTPSRWGTYDPALGQVKTRPDLDFGGREYEMSPSVMFRRLPNVTSICVAIPPGFKVNQETMEALEQEYKKTTGQT